MTEPKPRDPRPPPAEPAMALDVADRDWAEELAWHDMLDQAAVPPDEAELATAGPDPDWGPPEGWGWDQFRELEALPRSWTAGFAGGGVLDGMAPDPVLARFAWDACDAGIEALPDDELVGLLLASRKLESQHAAVELAAVAELDRRRMATAARPGSSRASEHVSEELAAALVLTGRAADVMLGLVRGLCGLPMVWASLHAGRIDLPRARVFADELAALSEVKARACAAALIDQAGALTTGQLRTALRRLVAAADPQAARRRAEHARTQSRVECWGEGSGNSALAGRELPPDEVIAADERITAIAHTLKAAGAPGTMDQLRAAVFTSLLMGRDPAQLAPGSRPDAMRNSTGWPPGFGCRPTKGLRGVTSSVHLPEGLASTSGSVHLTMPLASWLGLSESPGEIAGHGPLDAWSCRSLASKLAAAGSQARWCVTLTDPVGRAVAHACAKAGPPAHGPPAHGPPAHAPPGHSSSGRGQSSTATWLTSLAFRWLEAGTCSHVGRSPAYRPPSSLAHLVRVRQRTCCFPGCRRPARRCDLDHTTPYEDGGITCECNLASLCRRHHRAKQAPGWTLTQPEPGILVWTLPHGRSYITQPGRYPD